MLRIIAVAFALAVAMQAPAVLAQTVGSLPLDEESTRNIAEFTTDERYLTDWVRVLPDHPTVPSPREVLGYTVGTPSRLTQVDDIHRYMRELAAASPRVRVFDAGQSFEGREMIVVAIANEATLNELEAYRTYLHRLADPRKTTRDEAQEIIGRAKPIYWMTAGLHSPELGPPEMTMELAYRLAVEDREPFANIRDNVITIITPVLESDGRARQVEWWRRHVKGHKDYKDMPPRSSPFWGHYTFHDNNRDAIAISQPLTRNYVDTYFHWLPTVSLDLHESVPLLYVSTGTGPYNERIDPITVSEWHALANYEITRLSQLGLPGVWTWGFYTGWFPGYLLWVTNNHNSMGRFYETFGNGTAETLERDLREAKYAGKKLTEKQWYRSVPPDEKLEWSMRNNTNFMQSGAIASLEMVANNREMFLRNFFEKGVNALSRAREKAPYAFVIRREQRDVAAARDVLVILDRHGIEMGAVRSSVKLGEKDDDGNQFELERGDILVKLEQPYGALARNLLEAQEFPEDVEVPPYDDVAWTLGLHMGVTVDAVDIVDVLDVSTDTLEDFSGAIETPDVPDKAKVWVIPHRAQRELGPLRLALGTTVMSATEEAFEHRKQTIPAGSLVIDGNDVDAEALRGELQKRGLGAIAVNNMPDVPMHDVDVPRVAMYHAWWSTQNAGWVRYSLDTAGVEFTLIDKDDIGNGRLDDYDVLLMPSYRGGTRLESVIAGIDRKWSPLAYTKTAETPSHGDIKSSEDITGGLGYDGMARIDAFVRRGGTLIALGSAGVIAADSGMSRRIDVSRPSGLRSPGSFVSAKVLATQSPLVYGYEGDTHVFRGNGPIYDVDDYDRHLVALQFGHKKQGDFHFGTPAEEDAKAPDFVLSGGVVGQKKLDGKPAIVAQRLGEGRLVLFSWNPMHRHLNHHDHAFVYNALLHWNDIDELERPAAEVDDEEDPE